LSAAVNLLRREAKNDDKMKIIIGGQAINQALVKKVKADSWAEDAMSTEENANDSHPPLTKLNNLKEN